MCRLGVNVGYLLLVAATLLPCSAVADTPPKPGDWTPSQLSKLLEWESAHLEWKIAKHQLLAERLNLSTIQDHQLIYRKQSRAKIKRWQSISAERRRGYQTAFRNLNKSALSKAEIKRFLEWKEKESSQTTLHRSHFHSLFSQVRIPRPQNLTKVYSLDNIPLKDRNLATAELIEEAINVILIVDRNEVFRGSKFHMELFKKLAQKFNNPKNNYEKIELNSMTYSKDNGHLIRNLLLEWEDQTRPTLIVSIGKGQEAVIDFLDNFPSYTQNKRILGWVDFRATEDKGRTEAKRIIATYSADNPAVIRKTLSRIERMKQNRNAVLPINTSYPVLQIRRKNQVNSLNAKESALTGAKYYQSSLRNMDDTIHRTFKILQEEI